MRIGGRRPGNAPAGSAATGGAYGLEISSTDDMLSVYEASGGRAGAPLWREQRPGGFSGSAPTLFDDFKADVEKAAKRP